MKFSIELTMVNTEGALERVLGKLRQRSFDLCSVVVGRRADCSALDARIVVEGTRPFEPVAKQLWKLFDVQHLRVNAMEGAPAHVYSQQDATQKLGLVASL